MTVSASQPRVADVDTARAPVQPLIQPRKCTAIEQNCWIFGRQSVILGETKSLWQGARCLQRISAHLDPLRRPFGLPPQDSDEHGITRRVAHGFV